MQLHKIKIIAAGFPRGEIRMVAQAPSDDTKAQQELLKQCAEQDASKSMVFFLMDGYIQVNKPAKTSTIIKPTNGEINRLGGKG